MSLSILPENRDVARKERLRVGVSGATGLVGSALTEALEGAGYEPVALVRPGRTPGRATDGSEIDAVPWDPARGILDPRNQRPLDAIVHLAGENIAGGRWSKAQRQRLRDSRVAATEALVASFRELPEAPKTLLCASASGFYGDRGDTVLTEDAHVGSGFLAEICRDWEAAACGAQELGTRVVHLRFGVVLSTAGGALAKMLPIFRLGLGGRLGSGRQYFPWISRRDAVAATLHLLDDPGCSGPWNFAAPQEVDNAAFTKALSQALRRPAVMAVPALALRLAFGAMAEQTLLASTRLRPQRLQEIGFEYRDPDLASTLRRLVGR